MEAEVFNAFRSIGVAEDPAIAAATALSRRDTDVHALKADIGVMKWMLGFNMAMSAAVMLKIFMH